MLCVILLNIMLIVIFLEVWEDFVKIYFIWIFIENGLCFKSYVIVYLV